MKLLGPAVVLIALPVSLLAQAPAALIDAALADVANAPVRLANTDGSLWRGRGELVVADAAADERRQRWLAISWHAGLDPARGAIVWQVAAADRTLARFALGYRGFTVDALNVDAPARLVLERIPHAFGHAGWRGRLDLYTDGWSCDWRWRCKGSARLDWRGATAELLQNRPLGDYRLDLHADGDTFTWHWSTLAGAVVIDGDGGWQPPSAPVFEGRVGGDPALLRHLPGIAGDRIRAGDAKGEYRIAF